MFMWLKALKRVKKKARKETAEDLAKHFSVSVDEAVTLLKGAAEIKEV